VTLFLLGTQGTSLWSLVHGLDSPCHAVEPSDGTCLRQSTKMNGQGWGQFQIADWPDRRQFDMTSRRS
jgi:hypothetical protein